MTYTMKQPVAADDGTEISELEVVDVTVAVFEKAVQAANNSVKYNKALFVGCLRTDGRQLTPKEIDRITMHDYDPIVELVSETCFPPRDKSEGND
jgi:hypothetical protein